MGVSGVASNEILKDLSLKCGEGRSALIYSQFRGVHVRGGGAALQKSEAIHLILTALPCPVLAHPLVVGASSLEVLKCVCLS